MWNVSVTDEINNWTRLRADIAHHGLRNSLLLAPMPTASTAQILGNNESIEPYTSNIYSRRVLSGEFQVCMCDPMCCRHVWLLIFVIKLASDAAKS